MKVEKIHFQSEGMKVIGNLFKPTSNSVVEQSKRLQPRLAIAKVIIPFSWNSGEPYEVGITTSDGVRFKKNVEAAALTPTASAEQISFFTIIGTYVGIIPILIGLLWFPFIKRLSRSKYIFFLALTAGLLCLFGNRRNSRGK